VGGTEATFTSASEVSYYDYPDDNTYPVDVPDGGEVTIKSS